MSDAAPEERLGFLLGVLPPAPQAWVAAAIALPEARRALAHVDVEALAAARARGELIDELESALTRAELEATPERMVGLRRLLDARRDPA